MKSACPVCEKEVIPGTEWCPHCGTPLMEGAADTTFVGREQDVGGRPTIIGAPALVSATAQSPAVDRTVIRRTGDLPRPGPPVADEESPAHDATVVRRVHEPSMTPFDDLEQSFAATSVRAGALGGTTTDDDFDEALSPTTVGTATLGSRPIAERVLPARGREQPITTPEGKAAPEHELLLGTKLGDYTLKSVLGTGSMGVVYAGFHALIGKRVAIKLLKKDAADNEEEASRFLEEARAANAVGHRGIIDIFGFDKAPDGRPYFVMEFLQGQSLGAYLEKFAPLPVPQALQILDEILAALGAAHDAGVIHRDLKPNNIFLVSQPDKTMYVKVLDFGLAKRSQFARGDTPQTSVSRLVGTPDYMAPEQARGEAVGPRSDLYSLGCMAFVMLTGRPPFVGKSGWEVVAMHMSAEPPVLSELNSTVPTELSDLIARLLSKMPAERPDTAEALREELKLIRRTLRVDQTRLFEAPREAPTAPAPVATDATMQNLAPPRRNTANAIATATVPAAAPLARTTEPAAVALDGTQTLPPSNRRSLSSAGMRPLSSETLASIGDLKPRLWPYVVGTLLFVAVLVAISVVLARSSTIPDAPHDPPPVRQPQNVEPPIEPPPKDPLVPTVGEPDPVREPPDAPPDTPTKKVPKGPRGKKGDPTHKTPGKTK